MGGTDQRGEWVSVCNNGAMAQALARLEIADYTRTQQHVHVYRFPSARGGGTLTLAPGGVDQRAVSTKDGGAAEAPLALAEPRQRPRFIEIPVLAVPPRGERKSVVMSTKRLPWMSVHGDL
jgi:hypothetical protein